MIIVCEEVGNFILSQTANTVLVIIVCEEVGNFILSQTANTVLVYYRDANFLPFFILQTQILIHIRSLIHMNTHTHTISMNTFKRLSRLHLEIYEVSYQKRLAIDEDIASH
jgi:hypothetical protein